MCEQNALSKLYGNLLQTSSLWHRDALVNGRVTRSFGRICLRARPQDDIVEQSSTVGSVSAAEHRRFPYENRQTRRASALLGFAPCTPIRECEHRCLTIILQFDILFFHIQVCQQSEGLNEPLFFNNFSLNPLTIGINCIIIIVH